MKGEKVKFKNLNLRIPETLILIGRKCFEFQSELKYPHPDKLNFSKFLTNCLIKFYKQQEINPSELEELIQQDRHEGIDKWLEEKHIRIATFYQGLIARRLERQREKYERVGEIIKQKDSEWVEYDDEGVGVWGSSWGGDSWDKNPDEDEEMGEE